LAVVALVPQRGEHGPRKRARDKSVTPDCSSDPTSGEIEQLTSGLSGGGSGPVHDHRVQDPTKALVTVFAVCSRLAVALPNVAEPKERPEKLAAVLQASSSIHYPRILTQSRHFPGSYRRSLRASSRRVAERR